MPCSKTIPLLWLVILTQSNSPRPTSNFCPKLDILPGNAKAMPKHDLPLTQWPNIRKDCSAVLHRREIKLRLLRIVALPMHQAMGKAYAPLVEFDDFVSIRPFSQIPQSFIRLLEKNVQLTHLLPTNITQVLPISLDNIMPRSCCDISLSYFWMRFLTYFQPIILNPIQNGRGAKRTPYLFFPCNFHKCRT